MSSSFLSSLVRGTGQGVVGMRKAGAVVHKDSKARMGCMTWEFSLLLMG